MIYPYEIVSGCKVIFSGPFEACTAYFAECGGDDYGWKLQQKAPVQRLWRVRQGSSSAKIRGADIAAARDRAAQIGFNDPSDIVLIDEIGGAS